jgi:hypothetical protein
MKSTYESYERFRIRNRCRTIQSHATICMFYTVHFLVLSITGSYGTEVIPEYRNEPSIHVISPLQGSYNSGERCEISWLIENFSPQASSAHEFNESTTDHVIIFVNGIKAISSTTEVEGKVSLQQLSAGAYRIDAMLGRYDELDGIISVLSNHVVEFFVDLQPVIRPSSRLIHHREYLNFHVSARSCQQL